MRFPLIAVGARARRVALLLAAGALALGAGPCGSTGSAGSFKGEQHNVAQTIADLQSDASAGEQGKICSRDLAAAVVEKLNKQGKKGCETAIKEQINQVGNFETTVESVNIESSGRTATAVVKSIYSGKSREKTVRLVKEGGRWKVDGLV
jgi:hypothetical protein